MSDQDLSFALVSDSAAARRLRRLCAENGMHPGVVVGTWVELIELARLAYLISAPAEDWDQLFGEALAAEEDYSWSGSYSVAPEETRAAVESAYLDLLHAQAARSLMPPGAAVELPERVTRRYGDLVRLSVRLGGALPPDLHVVYAVLATAAEAALRCIRVVFTDESPRLSTLQGSFIQKLNDDAGLAPDAALLECLESLTAPPSAVAPPAALGAIQTGLFASSPAPAPLDASVQWLGCRDVLEEAEVAAGMCQRLLDQNTDLVPADIGLLIPDAVEYAHGIDDAFGLAGLPLAGLPVERWQRDTGREAVLHFLYTRQKPAPAMAIAACLVSPLMPWSRDEGAALAQTVMDRDYQLKPPPGASRAAKAMLDLLREGDETPESLRATLTEFAGLLSADEADWQYAETARSAADGLCAHLATAANLDWPALRQMVTPHPVASGATPDFNLEGVTVWREDQEPWRRVKHLLVLGFAGGHYPRPPAASPVFSSDELEALNAALGLALPTAAVILAERRARLKRQLQSVTLSVNIFVPRRSQAGEPLSPSASHVFLADLFGQANEADRLILDIDDARQRDGIRHLASAEPAIAVAPRSCASPDPGLGANLLALREDAAGQPRPESPSGLETLMVSPLAWLFRRLQAEPQQWAPEAADPLVLGQLAHRVFEALFKPERLPDRATLARDVAVHVDQAIPRIAPFMRAAMWQVERRNLVGSLIRATAEWLDVIEGLNAQIVANEVWLAGRFHHIDIHGQADLILALPDDRLLVVDYKRSSARKRRPCMQRGFDSQASLYRTMIETGGPKDAAETDVAERLRQASGIGVVYFMLTDGTSLADAPVPGSTTIANWESHGPDISRRALALIRHRLDQVATGHIALNGIEDAVYFEKTAGVTPYALDNSPLIAIFARPGQAEGLAETLP